MITALGLLAAAGPLAAQDFIEAATRDIRDNIVRINTVFTMGSGRPGFGFVIRELDDSLFVVTAAHVVFPDDDTDSTLAINVALTGYVAPFRASLVASDRDLDLALLRIDRPAGYQWKQRRVTRLASRGDRVWIVGRDQSLNPSATSFQGIVSDVAPDRIHADASLGEPGASGGPLMSGGRIVGLIIRDHGHRIEAIPIETVRETALRDWLGVGQIDPAEFPFVSAQAGLGIAAAGGAGGIGETWVPARPSAWVEAGLSRWFGFGLDVSRGGVQTGRFNDRITETGYQYQNRVLLYRARLHFYAEEHHSLYLAAGRMRLHPEYTLDGSDWTDLDDVPGITWAADGSAWWYGAGFRLQKIDRGGFSVAADVGFGRATSPQLSVDITDPLAEPRGNKWMLVAAFGIGFGFRPDAPEGDILR